VPSLGGEPGIYSARYAGPNSNATQNVQKLLKTLAGKKDDERRAYFYCVLAFVQHVHDPVPFIAEGRWVGTLLEEPRGEAGFGYDPIFYVPEYACSAAELIPAVKNQLSHRGKAVSMLLNQLHNIIISDIPQ
jgi:XTP/dITP diphosphohydrolase